MLILKQALRLFVLSLTASAFLSGAAAAQDRPFEQAYRVIVPQKVETGDRIEVIDFFWYG